MFVWWTDEAITVSKDSELAGKHGCIGEVLRCFYLAHEAHEPVYPSECVWIVPNTMND
jgi:hypothetical protein